MSFQPNFPPSMLARKAAMELEAPAGEGGKKREDYKKMKELEEARKAGTAPAMKDEEGRDINPHIPQYIMQAPWYYGAETPTLRHQRIQEEEEAQAALGNWYKKGVKEGPAATKYRPGACENCGAKTHQRKDCLERPRARGAKFTNLDIAPDEYLPEQDLKLGYEGKRDRWNGYDLEDHKKVAEEFQRIDEAKKLVKAQKLDESLADEHPDEDMTPVDEDEKYAEDMDMPGQKFETKQRITVRNLRIREDTAKYLYNLDVESAYYDPKTRSMRTNPFSHTGKDPSELPFAGDNFVRMSGDAMGIAQRQIFAWEAYEKGSDVHLQADPTKLEFLTREYNKRKEQHKDTQQSSLMEKYGGHEHLEAPPEILLSQSENYVEYSRHGTVVKGQEKKLTTSRYQEDVFTNNHTSVWGSYWRAGSWGYKCCHNMVRESYCTGEAGKVAQQTVPKVPGPQVLPLSSTATVQEDDSSSSDEEQVKKKKKKNKKKKKAVKRLG